MSPARTRMVEQREANVTYLATLALRELRSRQGIVEYQLRRVKPSETEKLLTLRQMENDLTEAVDRKVFGIT